MKNIFKSPLIRLALGLLAIASLTIPYIASAMHNPATAHGIDQEDDYLKISPRLAQELNWLVDEYGNFLKARAQHNPNSLPNTIKNMQIGADDIIDRVLEMNTAIQCNPHAELALIINKMIQEAKNVSAMLFYNFLKQVKNRADLSRHSLHERLVRIWSHLEKEGRTNEYASCVKRHYVALSALEPHGSSITTFLPEQKDLNALLLASKTPMWTILKVS